MAIDGSQPQAVLTGTPRPVRLLTERDREPLGLLHRPSTVVTRGHTDENLDNLATSFRQEVVEPLRGTRLGRQELAAELLEQVEGALFTQGWLDAARVARAPHEDLLRRTVVGLDPADPGAKGSEQALCVCALGADHQLYVLASEGHRGTVGAFLGRALDVARRHGAVIVCERNHGGSALLELLEAKMRELGVRVPYREVWASQGKLARADGAALLAEQGRLHLVGHHPELEAELTTFTGQRGERFDRGDAMVWALAELGGVHARAGSSESSVARWSDEPVLAGDAVASWEDGFDPWLGP